MEIEQTGTMLSLSEYAELWGKHPRTVKRWLADERLPGAVKDQFSGEWRIPRDSSPMQVASSEVAAPAAGGGAELALPAGWTPMPAVLEAEPTRLDELAEEGAFLTVAEAAYYLKVPQSQILANPGLFDVMPVGVNGSPRVPKRTVYAFEGGSR